MLIASELARLKHLRRQYPSIELEWFYDIAKMFWGDFRELHRAMAEEEARAAAEQEEFRRRLGRLKSRLRLSDIHHELALKVPAGVDREHVQAILAYGFLDPGRERLFAGRHLIPIRHVRENVSNKLTDRFQQEHLERGLRFLVSQGVVQIKGGTIRPETAGAFNLNELRAATGHGREIIQEAKRFLHVRK
jgi:hypothetical protein